VLIEMKWDRAAPTWVRALVAAALCAAVACKGKDSEGTVPVTADAGPPHPTTAVVPDAAAQPAVAEEVSVRIQRELDSAAKLDPETAAKMKTVRPVLRCVEKVNDTEWRAHFGFNNPTEGAVSIPIGFYNRIWPPPISLGQPTEFPRGISADVVRVPFNGASSAAWILGASFQEARSTSPLCGRAASRHQ
jgi:hypothetical protein